MEHKNDDMTTPLIDNTAMDDFHDAREGLELEVERTRSVTFGDDGLIDDAQQQAEEVPEEATTSRPTSGMRTSSLPPRKVSFVDRSAKWPVSLSDLHRDDHMAQLIRERRQSVQNLFEAEDVTAAAAADAGRTSDARRETMELHSDFVRHLKQFIDGLGGSANLDLPAMEIRLKDVSYKVPSLDDGSGSNKIQTIYNTSAVYTIRKCVEWLTTSKKNRPEKKKMVTNVLSDINLVLKPKCMYLVLGPPLSGKTSLLKAIAGMLPQGEFSSGYPDKKHLTGQILYNNLVCSGEGADETKRTLFQNLVAFVRQSDVHAPRLTVAETFLFSGNCKDEHIRKNKKGTATDGKVGLTMEGLGLSHVQDTFVGNEQIRGVSGGQRRRVTLGEMIIFDTPLFCGDEISTGLDTASTVDILRITSFISRVMSRISVVSLLQPSPEAVSLFDEVILLSDGGRIIFTGPTEEACDYFRQLGYVQPDSMDDADYLLAVASSDRKHLYSPPGGDGKSDAEPHSAEAFAESFRQSKHNDKIVESNGGKWDLDWAEAMKQEGGTQNIDKFKKKYQNSFWVSVWLNLKRSFVLWKRDRIFIRASIIKNVAMGLSVGFVFLNTDMVSSFFGVLFQGNLFIMLGAMTSAPGKLDDRAVFYKHDDSNFYPALSYVIGQALALIPQMIIDVFLFGTFVYWMVGFVATAQGFIIYLVLFFTFNFTMGQLFGLLASVAPSKTVVQAGGAVILLLNVLFCGYIVSPTVIPNYYIWIYWMMPLAWVYRALLLNEFTSDDYVEGEGDAIMRSYGFLYNGEPFQREWIAYCFAYIVIFLIICIFASAAGLHYLRMEAKPSASPAMPESEDEEKENEEGSSSLNDATFIPVNLSFKDLCYEVKASKGSEKLRLLNNVSGVFSAGRMCALMGESGAGKTTLMDVIALRKGSGNITGDIRLNGFEQEAISFRRCSGYVEQFDVQSAELTVRETIRFSAQLRLDKSNHVDLEDHIEFIIKVLELTREADILVGSEEEGGLTFEQKKRLSIAVEIAASPSIIFLDEPTSGLDARAALLVMNALRKMCNTGRTVVATIHQPSSTVFDMFDDLLLLKKGGEVVFFGDLGVCSTNLVTYFEGLGASTMNKGENPATWMLNALGEQIISTGESGEDEPLNFARAWDKSSNFDNLQKRLTDASGSQDAALEIKYDSKFAETWYRRDTLMANRLVTIYWRSPAYNLSRMSLSLVIAFLLGSMFIPIRRKTVFSEAEMTSMLSTIFIAFIIVGVLSITSVLPVMLSIRDMYYRHKAAGMLNSRSVGRALASAEKRFILISSVLFCGVFLPTSGIINSPDVPLGDRVKEGIAFWGFFTFNTAIYSYIGQLFICLVPGAGTAQILASVFIGINNFFSGLIVRPQQMTGFWQLTYWINPGHFVYEGLVMSVFYNDNRSVVVSEGSDYYIPLGCSDPDFPGKDCEVPVHVYVDEFFGGLFKREHNLRNALILGGILFVVRMSTFLALSRLTYSGK